MYWEATGGFWAIFITPSILGQCMKNWLGQGRTSMGDGILRGEKQLAYLKSGCPGVGGKIWGKSSDLGFSLKIKILGL